MRSTLLDDVLPSATRALVGARRPWQVESLAFVRRSSKLHFVRAVWDCLMLGRMCASETTHTALCTRRFV